MASTVKVIDTPRPRPARCPSSVSTWTAVRSVGKGTSAGIGGSLREASAQVATPPTTAVPITL